MPVITPDIDALAYVINGVRQLSGTTPEMVLVSTLDNAFDYGSLRTVRIHPKTREQTTVRVQTRLTGEEIQRETEAVLAEHGIEKVLVVNDVPADSGNMRVMRYTVPGVGSSISCRYRPV